jgi:flagellar biosynthesis GTPase FlhF
VHLHVKPEVSTLDFNNAILLQGFRIPALSTRRAETDIELMNGQTFAIAGLMNNTIASSLQKIPGIGDIPILGQLFRSRNVQKDQTELVVMITPEILPRNSPGVTPNLPRGPEQFLPPLPPKQSRELPPPAFTRQGSSTADAAPAPAEKNANDAKQNDPAAAAAAVTALTPSTPKVVNAPAGADTPRPLTKDEQAALDRAKKVEAQQQQQSAKQSEKDKKQAEKDAKAKAEADKRQAAIDKAAQEAAAKREAEKAKRDAEIAKKQAEQDRKQAEFDKKRQKALGEAQAKMKAAQAEYDAEVSKIKKEQDKDK